MPRTNCAEIRANAAKIGLTGTPITRGRKTDTYRIFGQPIDTYTLRESESDGATVPIRYEGRPFEPRVIDRVELDATYEAEISGTTHDRERVTRCIRLRDVLSAEGVIADKARDMLHHWVDAVLPNGFKAQVVAASRLAAVRYRDALLAARDELVRDLEEYRDGVLPADQEAESFLQRALPYLALLRVIDFVPVISAGQRKGQKRVRRSGGPGRTRSDRTGSSSCTSVACPLRKSSTTRCRTRSPSTSVETNRGATLLPVRHSNSPCTSQVDTTRGIRSSRTTPSVTRAGRATAGSGSPRRIPNRSRS
ncbi:MAG: hypothetical protein WKF73_09955 [Nocardioidaceae bacterium]